MKRRKETRTKTPRTTHPPYETLLYEVDDAIATITLNRPDRLNTIVPPTSQQYRWATCRFSCNTCGVQSADHSNIVNATSNHPGGCNVLMGDGHVQFIKSSISMNTWWSLGTRAGGEVISSDSY